MRLKPPEAGPGQSYAVWTFQWGTAALTETLDFGQSEKASQRSRAERFVFLFGSVVCGKMTVVYIGFLKNFGS